MIRLQRMDERTDLERVKYTCTSEGEGAPYFTKLADQAFILSNVLLQGLLLAVMEDQM